MSRETTDVARGATVSTESSFPYSVLRSRWLLIVALVALVAFGGDGAPPPLQYVLLGAMILSNLVLAYLRDRDIHLTQALEVITVADVLVVTLVISWVDPSPETYLAVFAALVLASALGRVGVIMVLMLLVCAVYAVYLYTEVGPNFWRDVKLILRVPFIFALGLHFASIASYLKSEKAKREDLLASAKQHAERADQLSREQDRLRSLSHIGRLALTSAEAPPVRVLLEMTHRAQRALDASRCSLFVLRLEGNEATWNGRTKDRNTEVRTLPADLRPEALQELLLNGKLTEIHPGESKELMAKVKEFFPDSNPFGSVLVSPIEKGDSLVGAIFLIDSEPSRKYSEGERDLLWTVSLMAGAFIEARRRLESEIRLRTLITNAPVIMFATATDGTIELFEGRGSDALGGRPADRIGKSIFKVADDPGEIKGAFEVALSGRLVAGTLSLDGTVFETQYSPLRSLDGDISGVMGVTTAILVQEAPAAAAAAPRRSPESGAPPAPGAPPQAASVAAPVASPTGPTAPEGAVEGQVPPAVAPEAPPGPEGLESPERTQFPTPSPDLRPQIPLADEDPDA